MEFRRVLFRSHREELRGGRDAAVELGDAVGGVFLLHGIAKFDRGIGATAQFLAMHHIPFATIFAVILMTIETVGALCVLLGILTRAWAAVMAVEMAVGIVRLENDRPTKLVLE